MRAATAVIIVIGLALSACAGDDSRADTPTTTVGAANEADTSESTEALAENSDGATSVSVERSANIGLVALVHVDAEVPVRAQVTASSGDHVVSTPLTSAADSDLEIPVVGLRPDRSYAIDIDIFDETDELIETVTAEFATDPLPSWIADHDVTVDAARTSPGYTIVEFDPALPEDEGPFTQYLAAYDDTGAIVWYYTNSGTLGGVEQTVDGTFLMHYWPFGIREVDMAGNVVAQWRPQPTSVAPGAVDDEALVSEVDPDQIALFGDVLEGNEGDAEPTPVRAEWIDLLSFHHENWPMPNGNVLALSSTTHALTADQRSILCPGDPVEFDVVSDVAVEFDRAGTVLRTWDLWDVIDVMEYPGAEMCVESGLFAEPDRRDWTHANSVVYDPERDAVIVSVRHTDQIIAFDHLDDEGPQGDVRWVLGAGATMPFDAEPTYHQHAVEVNDDGSLVVFDNGNLRPGTSPDDPENPPYSRAVIYDVDDTSADSADWSARQRWEYRADDADGTPVYSDFISDADVLANGNVLITFGGIGTFPPTPADPLRALIVEVVPTGASGGDVVMQITTKDGQPNTVYRSERIETFYAGPEWTARI